MTSERFLKSSWFESKLPDLLNLTSVVKGAKSATMRFSYPFTLCRRGVIATLDFSAENLDLLESDHWLADRKNVIHVIQLHLTNAAY